MLGVPSPLSLAIAWRWRGDSAARAGAVLVVARPALGEERDGPEEVMLGGFEGGLDGWLAVGGGEERVPEEEPEPTADGTAERAG